MEIMVTMPEAPEDRQALVRRAAQLHAEAVCTALQDLRCPAEQKTALIQALIRSKWGKNGEKRGRMEHS